MLLDGLHIHRELGLRTGTGRGTGARRGDERLTGNRGLFVQLQDTGHVLDFGGGGWSIFHVHNGGDFVAQLLGLLGATLRSLSATVVGCGGAIVTGSPLQVDHL